MHNEEAEVEEEEKEEEANVRAVFISTLWSKVTVLHNMHYDRMKNGKWLKFSACRVPPYTYIDAVYVYKMYRVTVIGNHVQNEQK